MYTILLSPVEGKMLLPTNLLLQSIPQVLGLSIPICMGLKVILKADDKVTKQPSLFSISTPIR